MPKKPVYKFDVLTHFAIMDKQGLNSTARLIMLHIARRGRCYQSAENIAKNLEIGKATVIRHRKALLEMGAILGFRNTENGHRGLCISASFLGVEGQEWGNCEPCHDWLVDEGCIYIIKQSGSNLYKIGKTAKDPQGRLRQLQTGNPNHLTLRRSFWTDDITGAERAIHAEFAQHRVAGGEWFDLDGEGIEEVNLWIDGYLMAQEIEL